LGRYLLFGFEYFFDRLYSVLRTIVLKIEYNIGMLDILTKSTVRKKILLLFFYNQNKEFYLREIAKLVESSPGTTKREIDRLMKQNLLTMFRMANASFYKLNLKNQLIPYLEGIIANTIGIEIVLKNIFTERKDVKFAFIFGSYAKQQFKSDSDIDLYVIGEIDGKKLHNILQKAEEHIHRPINYHLATLAEFEENFKKDFFHQEIASKYILLTNNEDEFRTLVG